MHQAYYDDLLHCIQPAKETNSEPEQVLEFREHCPIGLLISGSWKNLVVIKLFALLVAVIVADVERRARVDSVGQKKVQG